MLITDSVQVFMHHLSPEERFLIDQETESPQVFVFGAVVRLWPDRVISGKGFLMFESDAGWVGLLVVPIRDPSGEGLTALRRMAVALKTATE